MKFDEHLVARYSAESFLELKETTVKARKKNKNVKTLFSHGYNINLNSSSELIVKYCHYRCLQIL